MICLLDRKFGIKKNCCSPLPLCSRCWWNLLSLGLKHSFPQLLGLLAGSNPQLSFWDLLLAEELPWPRSLPFFHSVESNLHSKIGPRKAVSSQQRTTLKSHSSSRASYGNSWSFCRNCYRVHLLLPNPDFFTALQLLFLRARLNKPPPHRFLPQSVLSGDLTCGIFYRIALYCIWKESMYAFPKWILDWA